MSTTSLRRKAVIAAIATAGGLAVPLVAAPSAFAAPPTGITVAPTTQNAAAGGSATIAATLTGTGATNSNGVYFRVTAGPDATTGNTGTLCSAAANPATCTVANTNAGTDTVQVYYNAANATGGAFQSSDPSTTATVVFAGPATQITVAPATGKAATNSTAAFTITGTDANGMPATGSQTVTISQTTTTDTNPLVFTNPTATAFPAAAAGTQTASADTNGGAAYTVTKTVTFVNGAASVGVASKVAGTVALNVGGANTTTFTGGNATLTVSAGNSSATASTANDDVARTLTLAAGGSSFINKTITDVATVTNAAGDPLGGVTVVGKVTGPNAGATVTSSGTTDQLGHATLTYQAGGTAGTDTLQAYVNQDTHTVNTVNADSGEPQATTTETLVAEPAGLTLTSNHDGAMPEPLTKTTQTVTYTLKDGNGNPVQGLNLNFVFDDEDTSPTPNDFTLAPSSGTTDANGQVTVTITDPTPAAGDTLVVDASLNGDDGVFDDNVELDYQAAAATPVVLTPARQSLLKGATVTETATIDDQFGTAVSGAVVNFVVTGRNNATNNTGATGTCTTGNDGSCNFTYTDVGTALSTTASNNVDMVQATSTAGTVAAEVDFVASTTATAITVNADNGGNAGVSPAPAAGGSTDTTAITAAPANASGPLYNTNVTFTSTGVGTFTDADGNAASSTTVKTNSDGEAIIYVRSANPGTQTITATADGVNDTTSVDYSAEYVPVTPTRVVDTRTGQGAVYDNDNGQAPAKLQPNTVYFFDYSSVGNMPLNENAYAFNVTAIDPSGPGNLRVENYCNDDTAPTASLINYQKGVTSANFAVISNNNGNCGGLEIYSAGSSASVAIDLVGYYAGGISSVTPTRIADTRTGLGGTTGALTAGTPQSFQVSGKADIPTNAKAVALNVTAVGPTGLGNLAVYPDGATKPTASSINYIKGSDKAAFVIVNLPADGKIDVVSNGSSANVAIDAFAYYPAASHLVTQAPVRILDTRTTTELAKNKATTVQVSGTANVPADAQAVLVSVTAIHGSGSTGTGNLRVYPTGSSLPTVSTVNYVSKTSDVANFDIVKLGTGGKISLYSAGSPINVALDVVGYVPAGS